MGKIPKAKQARKPKRRVSDAYKINPRTAEMPRSAKRIPTDYKKARGMLGSRILVRESKKGKHRGPGKTLRRDIFRHT